MTKNIGIILFFKFFLCLLFGIQLTSFGKKSLASEVTRSTMNPLTIIIPPSGEKAYEIAGEAFAELWGKVTGQQPIVIHMESGNLKLPDGDVVLIGSDAVNPVVHELIRSGTLESLNIVYGEDNYRMLSINQEGKSCLILAGGSGRSTIYAAYDFFRKQAGAEYFWDGDVVPHHDKIQLSGIDVLEQPVSNIGVCAILPIVVCTAFRRSIGTWKIGKRKLIG